MLDNHSGAKELWLRSGFQWDITNNVSLRSQVYGYDAHRHWFNNEINSFNDSPTPCPERRAKSTASALRSTMHQRLYGNVTDLTINSNIGGMDNRFVDDGCGQQPAIQRLAGYAVQRRLPSHLVNPDRGLYGPQRRRRSTPTSTMSRCRSRTG